MEKLPQTAAALKRRELLEKALLELMRTKGYAQVTVTDGVVSAMTFRVRQYTVSGSTSLLLPLRQTLAIAAQQEGPELSIGYDDSGAGTAGAAWLAE